MLDRETEATIGDAAASAESARAGHVKSWVPLVGNIDIRQMEVFSFNQYRVEAIFGDNAPALIMF